MSKQNYCGCIPIIGHPNVGKSTLLNQLLGQKISITSRKPHTTRQRIIGISTHGSYQAIYVDTPGIQITKKNFIHSFINYIANGSICNIALVIFIIDSTHWTHDDEIVVNKLRHLKDPVILAINKVDKIKNKTVLLPYIDFLNKQMDFIDIVPISAERGINIDIISRIVRQKLPEDMHYFPEYYITDRSEKFIASEIIREKIMRFLGAELPYFVTVEIKHFVYIKNKRYNIHAIILVQRKGQKKIIIGNTGSKIKIISLEARKDMEAIFKTKVYLELWVKVKSGCSNK
uniref:GTPase Era n=1 Tax=Candidatus Profftia sp. (ex Adelges kitamiensis) TaxID=2864218 RepID=UPI001CE286E5|nr:GTPase Era [Candidatus Profftia sp. (ex Adelges kitamiensis)]